MKKIILTTALAVFTMGAITAQETKFGLAANFTSAATKLKLDDVEVSDGAIGFSVGALVDIPLSEKLHLKPEVLFTSVKDSDAEEGVQFLQVPLYFKYYVIDKLYLQGGPQVTYTLEDIDDDNFTKFNFGLGAGIGYDITEDFFVQTRSTYQINNYFTGSEDIKSRINFFNVGVGYTF